MNVPMPKKWSWSALLIISLGVTPLRADERGAATGIGLEQFYWQATQSDLLVLGEVVRLVPKKSTVTSGASSKDLLQPILGEYQVHLKPLLYNLPATPQIEDLKSGEGLTFNLSVMRDFTAYRTNGLQLEVGEKIFVFLSQRNDEWVLKNHQLDLYVVSPVHLTPLESAEGFRVQSRFFHSGLESSLAFDLGPLLIYLANHQWRREWRVPKSQNPANVKAGGVGVDQVMALIGKHFNQEQQRQPASSLLDPTFFDEASYVVQEQRKRRGELEKTWQFSILSLLSILFLLGVISQLFVKYATQDDDYR